MYSYTCLHVVFVTSGLLDLKQTTNELAELISTYSPISLSQLLIPTRSNHSPLLPSRLFQVACTLSLPSPPPLLQICVPCNKPTLPMID